MSNSPTDLFARDSHEDWSKAILESVATGVIVSEKDGCIVLTNRKAQEIFCYTSKEFTKLNIKDLVPKSSRHQHDEHRAGFFRSPGERHFGKGRELRALRKDGSEFAVEIGLNPLPIMGRELVLSSIIDVTDRKNPESALLRVSEEQQRKVGQDIHNDLCSQLFGIGCLTQVLEERLVQGNLEDAEMVRKIGELVGNAGTTARQIANGLVPSVLENRGLTSALEERIDTNRITYGIDIRLTVSEEDAISKISQETCVQLYHIAQEALTNAIRDSGAERISVQLSMKDSRLEMKIEDDGKGFNEKNGKKGKGFTTMRRRAKLILADLSIQASADDGTLIHCSVLLPSK